MDTKLYDAAISGDINVLKENMWKLEYEITNTNNTVLHLASQLGHTDCVEEILKNHPSLLHKTNSTDDTALHLAAQNGHESVCTKLIHSTRNGNIVLNTNQGIESGGGGVVVKEMLWWPNKEKDTALHLASRYNFHRVVRLLIEHDPQHPHSANAAGETPLYLAIRRGHWLVVEDILVNCVSPIYDGPQGTTALHAAVLRNNPECVKFLLRWETNQTKKRDVAGQTPLDHWETYTSLTRKTDETGQTPLHYGALMGYSESIRELMTVDKSCAYIQDDDEKNTALHMAAGQGHTEVMKQIVSFCPDSWDILNRRQKNILHIAMEQCHRKTVEFILENCPVISKVVSQRDVDGNTPFHLIATSLCFVPKLIYHPLVDKIALNKKNFTPLDLVTSIDHPPELAGKQILTWQREIVREMILAGATWSFHNSFNNNRDDEVITTTNLVDVSPNENEDSAEEIARMRKMGDTQMIVATLVATVTFAAGFTMPGGYQGSDGPDMGLAIRRKNKAFAAFIIADTIALAFSISAIGIYFSSPTVATISRLKFLLKFAGLLVQGAVQAMLVAFITGIYATLAPSKLAIATCVVGSLFSYSAVIFMGALSRIFIQNPERNSMDYVVQSFFERLVRRL